MSLIRKPGFKQRGMQTQSLSGAMVWVVVLSVLAGLVYAEDLPWAANYRLPEDTLPIAYDLILHPDLDAGTFSGRVEITIQTTGWRSYLLLHHKYLNVTTESLIRDEENSNCEVKLSGSEDYLEHEFWVVKAAEPIRPGTYRLSLSFTGDLTRDIVGFYRSVYQKESGNKYIATSKFQPTYARQAFPCFDEPGFKSNFTVRLVRPSDGGYNALSNMDVEKEVENEPETGLTTVYFTESVPMVTYLACFIVSDFESLDPIVITGNVPFRVYSTPEQVKKTEYALQCGVNITEYYIEYFNIPYPLPKLDMIAIPDFVSGAMEHWGLITYREVNLLYDVTISSSANKQRVATVIGHELAHMWFGNLMTLKWWDDLWLNEGFASYMEYKGVDHFHPDWAMMDQFLIEDLHPVLILDAALSSHPIVQQVSHPDEITELFDTISYNKGASVIRMLEDFMGEDNFQRGISEFLIAYRMANAETQDLWNALQSVVDETSDDPINITRIMDTWTRQMGFPVLTVTIDGNGNRVLSQSRFLADPNANTTNDISPYNYKWEVPITYITSASSDVKQTWLHSEDESVTVQTEGASWIKFNSRQIGYYRVNYPTSEWLVFSQLLQNNPQALEPADRAHLLEDAFSLANAGLLSYDVVLDMTGYLTKETEYVPWNVAATMFGKAKNFLIGSSSYAVLRAYLRSLVANAYESSTWDISEDDSHLKRRLRTTVLDLACSVGHEACLEEVKTKFEAWLSNPDVRPDPDIRSLIYQYGMEQSGSEANWDTVWNLYLTEGDAQEKSKLLNALARVKEPWLLKRFIQYSKDESYIRSQDFFNAITYVAQNRVGLPIVWDFIRSEWDYLVERFTLNNRYLGRIIPTVTAYFTTEFKLKEMESFFALYPDAGAGTSARSQALETVANNILWLSKHQDTFDIWLTSRMST